LAFDKFAGFTSGWVRFMLAEMELTRLRDGFRFDWQSARLAWQDGNPNKIQAAEMLARAKKFMEECGAVVAEETKVWAAEFQGVIRNLDDAAGKTR
jgi:hypothetical protein